MQEVLAPSIRSTLSLSVWLSLSLSVVCDDTGSRFYSCSELSATAGDLTPLPPLGGRAVVVADCIADCIAGIPQTLSFSPVGFLLCLLAWQPCSLITHSDR